MYSFQIVFEELFKLAFYFISYLAKFAYYIFFGTCKLGRIIKSDMDAISDITSECRAIFVCTTTDCDYIIPRKVQVFFDIVRCMAADVYASLVHYFDCKRIDVFSRFGAGRKHI